MPTQFKVNTPTRPTEPSIGRAKDGAGLRRDAGLGPGAPSFLDAVTNLGGGNPNLVDMGNGFLSPPPSGLSGGGGFNNVPPPALNPPVNPQQPDPDAPGVNPNDPIRPDVNPFAFPGLLQMLEQVLGIDTLDPAIKKLQAGFRGNLLDVLGGPVFSGDPGQLPGDPTTLGAALNLLLGQATQQSGRGQEREALLRGSAERSAASPQNLLNRQTSERALGLLGGDEIDRLQRQRENTLRSTLAASENALQNRLRDAGTFGTGRAGANPLVSLQARSADALQRGLLDISERGRGDRERALGLGAGIAGQGADTFRALERDPVLQLVDVLGRSQNPAIGALAEALAQVSNLQIGEALSTRGGSFFEEASPLLGSVLGSVGNVIGSNQIANALRDGSGGAGGATVAARRLNDILGGLI